MCVDYSSNTRQDVSTVFLLIKTWTVPLSCDLAELRLKVHVFPICLMENLLYILK